MGYLSPPDIASRMLALRNNTKIAGEDAGATNSAHREAPANFAGNGGRYNTKTNSKSARLQRKAAAT